jgi:hypothetical protein
MCCGIYFTDVIYSNVHLRSDFQGAGRSVPDLPYFLCYRLRQVSKYRRAGLIETCHTAIKVGTPRELTEENLSA